MNNYVATHYSSRHMSWLHCFWGVGTIISPYIMSYSLTNFSSWSKGYRIVSFIQMGIAGIVLISLPLWKKNQIQNQIEEEESVALSFKEKFKIKNIFYVLIGFFAYCALESTVMNWSATYMVEVKEITPEIAASLASLFFIGMTFGRFMSGIVSNKMGDKKLIRIGQSIILLGLIIISLPVKGYYISLIGFLTIGLGCAPIYPSIIHSTPTNFSKKYSQAIIGLQMSSAYVGATLMPPIFGVLAQYIDCKILPLYGILFLISNVIMLEMLNIKTNNIK